MIDSFQSGSMIETSFGKVYEYRHKHNGLKVLMVPKPGSGVTAFMRVILAGSKDENKLTGAGVAHFIEHMSFRQDKGAIWNLKAKINAETDSDSTRYYVICRSKDLKETLEVDASRMSQHAVDVDHIATERSAVLNELERGEMAAQKMFRTCSSVAILQHPYHHDTIGTRTDITQGTGDEMERFRETFYVPNNAVIILAGDFEPKTALEHIDETYGKLAPSENVSHVYAQEPPQIGKRTIQMSMDAPCGMICVGYRTPSGQTQESLCFSLLSVLAWHNNQGRAKSLIESGAVHDVGVYAPRQNQPYMWFTHATLDLTTPDTHKRAEEAIHNVMVSLHQTPFAEEEVERAKKVLKTSWARNAESVEGIMNMLGSAVSMGDWKDVGKRVHALESITAKDLATAAKQAFHESNMTVVHVQPSTLQQRPEMQSTPIQSLGLLETKAPEPNHLEVSCSQSKKLACLNCKIKSCDDASIHHVENSSASYIRLSVSTPFPKEYSACAEMVAACLGKCCAKGIEKDMAEQLKTLGADRQFSKGHEYIHMNADLPADKDDLQQSMELLASQWAEPEFHIDDLRKEQSRTIAELRSLKGNQKYLAKQAFMTRLYSSSPYSKSIQDKIREIEGVSEYALQDFYNLYMKQSPITMTVLSGDTSNIKIMKRGLQKLGSGKRGTEVEPQSWKAAARALHYEHVQCHNAGSDLVLMGQTVDVEPHTAKFTALQCAAHALGGGMKGMLMHTIREQMGLGTYGVYASIEVPTPTSKPMFIINGTFTPSVCAKGVDAIKQVVHQWAADLTEDQLEDAKERMCANFAVDSDNCDNVSVAFHTYALQKRDPIKEWTSTTQKIEEVTLADVQEALKEVDLTKMVTVVCGMHKPMSVEDESDEE